MYAGAPKFAQEFFFWSFHSRVCSSNWRKYLVVELHWYAQLYSSDTGSVKKGTNSFSRLFFFTAAYLFPIKSPFQYWTFKRSCTWPEVLQVWGVGGITGSWRTRIFKMSASTTPLATGRGGGRTSWRSDQDILSGHFQRIGPLGQFFLKVKISVSVSVSVFVRHTFSLFLPTLPEVQCPNF